MIETRKTDSTEETIRYAFAFAQILKRGDVVALSGELGSGKTQFVKGMCTAFNAHAPATSPSFVILNRYEGTDKNGNELLLYHFDLYRIKSIDELYDIGYEEYLQGDGICFIEWAETFKSFLPERRYEVHLSFGEQENQRRIEVWNTER